LLPLQLELTETNGAFLFRFLAAAVAIEAALLRVAEH
jgi:hypothetical protein